MRRVLQNGEEECGAACVAMLAGVTLKEARERLPPKCRTEGANSEQLRAALKTYGIETEARRALRGKDAVKLEFDAALLGTLDGVSHWAVWDAKRKVKLDPYKGGGKWVCNSFVKVTHRQSST